MKPIASNRIEFEGESIADRGCSMYTPVSTFKSIDFAEIISLQCVDKYVLYIIGYRVLKLLDPLVFLILPVYNVNRY